MMNIGLTIGRYIYVTVQYDMWLKCIIWGNVFPPTLDKQCG